MYNQTHITPKIKSTVCEICGSSRLLYKGGSITCSNCGNVIYKPKMNKYHAKKTEFNGKIFDSKFESSVAEQLEMRKIAHDIKDYDCQFRVEADVCNSNGEVICHKRHKVDFRVHNNDGSFELLEAKGVITSDYQWRRDVVVGIWLSEHKDYTYTVIQQRNFKNAKKINTRIN